jgi:hypothetical protein
MALAGAFVVLQARAAGVVERLGMFDLPQTAALPRHTSNLSPQDTS